MDEERQAELDAMSEQITNTILIKLGENLSGQITQEVEKQIQDKGFDQVRRKVGIFSEADLPKEVSKQQYRDAYLMAVLKTGIPSATFTPLQRKALSEGTDTAGGYLVQDEDHLEIIKRLPELSELFPYVRKVPVPTDAGNFPKLGSDVSITWGRAENASLTESDATLTQVTYSVIEMNALCYLSRELVTDSNPGIVEVVRELFGEGIAAERDKKIANGTGSSQPTGIFSASGISAVSGVSGALSYAKLVDLKYALARKYQNGARWIMNSTTLSWARKLTDDNSMPIIRDGLERDETMLLGKQYSIQDDIANGLIAYGRLATYYWFDRQRMVMETTTTGGDTFAKHQLAIKVNERCDGKPTLNSAFVKSGTFTEPS